MKIYNSFGIKPTNSYTSAGSDYYVPNIINGTIQMTRAYKAFEKSYGKTTEEIMQLHEKFTALFDADRSQIPNLVHLYLALYSPLLDQYKNSNLNEAILYFLNEYVIYDEVKKLVGVRLTLNDTVFINSGVKIALDTVINKDFSPISKQNEAVQVMKLLGIGVAGLYVNKSGKGNAGFDVRACLVDEDYSGFVHLSMAYTKDCEKKNIIYAGDKLTQMMLIPIFHDTYDEVTEEEYDKIMSDSERGDSGFGSTDIKH